MHVHILYILSKLFIGGNSFSQLKDQHWGQTCISEEQENLEQLIRKLSGNTLHICEFILRVGCSSLMVSNLWSIAENMSKQMQFLASVLSIVLCLVRRVQAALNTWLKLYLSCFVLMALFIIMALGIDLKWSFLVSSNAHNCYSSQVSLPQSFKGNVASNGNPFANSLCPPAELAMIEKDCHNKYTMQALAICVELKCSGGCQNLTRKW